MRFSFKTLPLLALPALAWADGPVDLRTSLRQLHGHAPVSVEVVYASHREHTTFLKPMVHEHSLRLQLVEDEAGLHVNWTLPALSANPKPVTPGPDAAALTPLGEVLSDLDPLTLNSLLNQAEALSALLETATFKAENRATYEGHPARVLTFTCTPRIPAQHQGRVLQAESILKIWIGDDGVPLATESMVDYVGRHSRLYGRIHSNTLVKTTYSVLDQRLVVTSQTSEDSIYDYGDRLKSNKTLTLATKG